MGAWLVFLTIVGVLIFKACQEEELFRWLEPYAPLRGKWLRYLIAAGLVLLLAGFTAPLAFAVRE